MRRILIALAVSAGSFLVSFTAAPAATAHPETTTVDVSTAQGEPLPPHDVRWARRGKTGDTFWTRGKVVTWKGRKVTLQSARRRTGRWTAVKSDRTTADQGVWSINFHGEVGRHYRVLIPKANWARATKVYVGRIVAE